MKVLVATSRSTAQQVSKAIKSLGDTKRAAAVSRFFKTGPGEYGEGDVFAGLTVPQVRKLAREHAAMSLAEVKKLLGSKIHEARLLALIIMVQKFQRADARERAQVYALYLKATARVNNWDLVDSSADKIVGAYLETRSRRALYRLARSPVIWQRRIAVIATFWFIRRDDFSDTLRLVKMLASDKHDLIHKACGWMLREVGKRDVEVLRRFLDAHGPKLPRTTLRYAIECLSSRERRAYLLRKR